MGIRITGFGFVRYQFFLVCKKLPSFFSLIGGIFSNLYDHFFLGVGSSELSE